MDASRGSGSGLALQALLEPLDLAGGVDDRLLAREERVAVRADVDAQLGSGGPDSPLGAARAAVDLGLEILGMDVRLHVKLCSPRRLPDRAHAQPVVAGYAAGSTPWRRRRSS